MFSGDTPYYHLCRKLTEWCRKLNDTVRWSDHETLSFKMKTYVLFIFHNQTNINRNKYIIVVVMIIFQFTPIYMAQNLKNAPAQVLIQLHHCLS